MYVYHLFLLMILIDSYQCAYVSLTVNLFPHTEDEYLSGEVLIGAVSK